MNHAIVGVAASKNLTVIINNANMVKYINGGTFNDLAVAVRSNTVSQMGNWMDIVDFFVIYLRNAKIIHHMNGDTTMSSVRITDFCFDFLFGKFC